jgi:hypothetical protein
MKGAPPALPAGRKTNKQSNPGRITFITMKHALIPSSVLCSIIPGLALTARPAGTGADFANSQECATAAAAAPSAEDDGALPSALRPDFARCVAVDPVSGKLFVSIKSPRGNSVLRFASEPALEAGGAPEAVFNLLAVTDTPGEPDVWTPTAAAALACDGCGHLWVADTCHHRVLRFDAAADLPSGAAASGVLGQAGFADRSPGASASRMNFPADIAVDGHGRLYVADTGNARVLWFNDAARRGPGASANGVVGQADFDSRGPGGVPLKQPARLAVEGGGRGRPVTLWVADAAARHVLRFDNATALPLTGARASAMFAGGKMAAE